MNQSSARSLEAFVDPLPPRGLPVQIQCADFKCMAFRDQEGQWINFFTREPIADYCHVIRNREYRIDD